VGGGGGAYPFLAEEYRSGKARFTVSSFTLVAGLRTNQNAEPESTSPFFGSERPSSYAFTLGQANEQLGLSSLAELLVVLILHGCFSPRATYGQNIFRSKQAYTKL
jgi:hypothetical protein